MDRHTIYARYAYPSRFAILLASFALARTDRPLAFAIGSGRQDALAVWSWAQAASISQVQNCYAHEENTQPIYHRCFVKWLKKTAVAVGSRGRNEFRGSHTCLNTEKNEEGDGLGIKLDNVILKWFLSVWCWVKPATLG